MIETFQSEFKIIYNKDRFKKNIIVLVKLSDHDLTIFGFF